MLLQITTRLVILPITLFNLQCNIIAWWLARKNASQTTWSLHHDSFWWHKLCIRVVVDKLICSTITHLYQTFLPPHRHFNTLTLHTFVDYISRHFIFKVDIVDHSWSMLEISNSLTLCSRREGMSSRQNWRWMRCVWNQSLVLFITFKAVALTTIPASWCPLHNLKVKKQPPVRLNFAVSWKERELRMKTHVFIVASENFQIWRYRTDEYRRVCPNMVLRFVAGK